MGAVIEQLAGANRDDRASGGLVFGTVGQHDAAGGDVLRFVAGRQLRDRPGVAMRLCSSFWWRLPWKVILRIGVAISG